jgi:hypothetical protein
LRAAKGALPNTSTDGNPSPMLLSAKAERLANWRLLQDLAGVREPAKK